MHRPFQTKSPSLTDFRGVNFELLLARRAPPFCQGLISNGVTHGAQAGCPHYTR